jgi:predicted Zn-dependent protease
MAPTIFASRVRVLLVLAALSQAPVRADAGDEEAFRFKDIDLKLLAEVELLDRRFERDGLVIGDADLTDYVTRLGRSLTPPGALERVTWRFRVLRDPLPNAFALPNGSIYVHSGLLGVLENEGQLASVLAHEVVHVVRRHSYLSQRGYRKKAAAISLIGFAGGAAFGRSELSMAVQLIAASAQVILAATINGYSRDLEREADLDGVLTMRAAGHDAGEMAGAFRQLQAAHDLEQDAIFYTDHPRLEERIAYVSESAGRATPPAASDPDAGRERYRIAVARACRDNVRFAIDARRYRSAAALAQRLVDDEPAVSDHAFLLAEAYRSLGPRTPRPAGSELTSKGRKRAVRLRMQLTAAEEERLLQAESEGQDALRRNQQQAEAHYRRALELDAGNVRAHRGLGLLYEASGRTAEALEAYRVYLELSLDAPDRERIRRRIDALAHAGPK